MSLRNELLLLRKGRVRFERFVARTGREWRALALYLMRRWPQPLGVEVADIEQELLIAVWRFVPRWDEKRGVSIDRFVVWNACNAAARWMHRQRGATRTGGHERGKHAGTGPEWKRSVVPILQSRIDAPRAGEREPIDRFDRLVSAKRFAEAGSQAAGDLSLLLNSPLVESLPPRQRLALAALAAEVDVDLAAERLYEEPELRWRCRLGSEVHARALVREAVQKFAASAALSE